jgi:WD40 repeat protein
MRSFATTLLIGLAFAYPSTVTFSQAPADFRQLTLRTQIGHSGTIFATAFSQNGQLLLSVADDGHIKLWDAVKGLLIRSIAMPATNARSIAFMENQSYAMVGDDGGNLGFYDISNGEYLGSLPPGHRGWVFSAVLLRDGHRILSGSNDGTVKLWEIDKEPHLVRTIETGEGILAVAVSPDEKTALSGDFRGSIKLWNLKDGRLIRRLDGHTQNVSAIQFFPDGLHTLSAGDDGSLRIWDVRTGRQVKVLRPPAKGANVQINAARVSPDGRMVISGGNDMKITAWDPNSGFILWVQQFAGGYIQTLAFSADGSKIVSGSFDRAVRIWNSNDGSLVAKLGGDAGFGSAFGESTTFLPGDRFIVTGGEDGMIRRQDLNTGRVTYFARHSSGNSVSPVYGIATSVYGRWLVSGGADGTVKIWDLETGKLFRTLQVPGYEAVAISPDGLTVAAAGENEITLWEIATGKEGRKLSVDQPCCFKAIAFSGDGKLLLGGRRPGDVRKLLSGYDNVFVWEVKSGNLVRKLPAQGQWLTSIAISPDGRSIITGGDEPNVSQWDLQTGIRIRTVDLGNVVTWVGFLPYSSVAISASVGKIAFWDYTSGVRIKDLQIGTDEIEAAALSSDGKWLAVSSRDSTDSIVDLRDQTLIATTASYTHVEPFFSANWAPSNWALFDPNGLFDSREIESTRQFVWIAADDPLHAFPPEIFMRDYYEPRLLPRLLACRDAKAKGDTDACKRTFRTFKSGGSLAALNRIQPGVRIAGVRRGASAEEALVDVEVAGKEDLLQKNGKTKTGVYDLRLFRDGQIVGQWPEPPGAIGGAEEIERWRTDSRMPMADGQEKVVHRLTVQLPRRDKGLPVKFTAYAFNEDRVKSETASDESYKVPDDVEPAKPRAYVITIGVNAYENPNWKLGFAAKDAQDLSGALQRIQGYEVIAVPLISAESGDAKLDQATKANIEGALALLAGKEEAYRERIRSAIGSIANELRKVTPDDLVILAFSGHGYTDPQARFYLLPSDSGTDELTDALLPKVLPKFISSDELSQWLKNVDAGEMVVLIDSCHSAASVPEGFKPGPMGDRGLGQLAYDKGMQILAATQADNVALESEKLGQGLLTYALVDDGLKARKAAHEGKGDITISSWLRFAEKRVPELYDDILAGKLKLVGKDPIIDPAFYSQAAQHAQTPALFDFYKQSNDPVLQMQ